jgi:pimeloyl-ACP methyl ester carboxylesterase
VNPVVFDVGGQGPALCFAHANGYPPGAYRQLFELLKPHFSIAALEHRPLWGGRSPPQRLSWQLFAEDMLQALQQRYDAPVWVMGHSMGAVTAAIAAGKHPELFAGLILLDPVFLPDRIVLTTRLLPAGRRRKIPMVRRALGRPEYFASLDEAFEFYRGKRAFRGLTDEALRDYVESSKAPQSDGRVSLRYSPEWEAAVYASPPRVRRTLRSLAVPTIGLRGRDSDVLSRDMYARWQHWQPSVKLRELPGGHLFPLEYPLETAKQVIHEVFGDEISGD